MTNRGFQKCTFVGGPYNGMTLDVSINDDQIYFAHTIQQYGLAFDKRANAPIKKSVYHRSKKDIRRFHFTHWE